MRNAWCRERSPYLEDRDLPAWTIAKRQFDRLIDQIPADEWDYVVSISNGTDNLA